MKGIAVAAVASAVVAAAVASFATWCVLRRQPAPAIVEGDSSSTARPPGSAPPEPTSLAATAVTPDLATLRAQVSALVPELRAHIAAGSTKHRDGAACYADLRKRHDRLNEIMAKALDARLDGRGEPWMYWDDPQREIADDLEDTIISLRGCVDCAAEDVKECAKAESSLRKLDASVRVVPSATVARKALPPTDTRAPAASLSPPLIESATTATTNPCNPPFTIDEMGHKKYKMECLK